MVLKYVKAMVHFNTVRICELTVLWPIFLIFRTNYRGHLVRQVPTTNLVHPPDSPLILFPKENNKDVYRVKYLKSFCAPGKMKISLMISMKFDSLSHIFL